MNILLINKESLIVENIIVANDLYFAIKLLGSNFICKEKVDGVEIGFLYKKDSDTFLKQDVINEWIWLYKIQKKKKK